MPKRHILFAAAAVSVAAIAFVVVCSPRLQKVGPDWTPRTLHKAIEDAGLHYEARAFDGRLYLRRPDAAIEWQDLFFLASPHVAKYPGCLAISPLPNSFGLDPDPAYIRCGHLQVWGHPDELAKVAAVVQAD